MSIITSLELRISNILQMVDKDSQVAELNSIAKTIKRCAKRETSLKELKNFEGVFKHLQEVHQKHFSNSYTKLKFIGEQIKERRLLLENKNKFLNPNELPRFDKYLKSAGLFPDTQTKILSIVLKMQLKNEPITENDIFFLTYKKSASLGNFLTHLKNSIDESVQRKEALVENILNIPDQSEGIDNRLKKYVLLKQILGNPLEFSVEPGLLKQSSLVNDFFVQCEQNKIIKDGKIPYNEDTLKFKTEGLKLIKDQALNQLQSHRQRSKEILISGFGPGGLTAGLVSSIQGHQITIIEKRKAEDRLRSNVLALGKENLYQQLPMFQDSLRPGNYHQADLRILDFFGVTDYLVTNKLVSLKEKAPWQDIAIGDLQKAMLNQLENVHDQNETPLVKYGTAIKEIQKNDSNTSLVLSDGTIKNYDTVIVMEGAKSSTRAMLGIDVHKHSKAARMALSFFKVKREQPSTLTKSAKKLSLYLKMLPIVFKLIWNKRISSSSSDLLVKTWGRALLVLKTPQTDYGYATLTDEEEQILNECENARAEAEAARESWANRVLLKLKAIDPDSLQNSEDKESLQILLTQFDPANQKNWFSDQDQISEIFTHLKKIMMANNEITNGSDDFHLESQFNELLIKVKELDSDNSTKIESIKEKVHRGIHSMNVAMDTLFNEGQRATEHIETFFAKSQITQAEKSLQKVGSTTFYIGGDAASTTDPVSGSGCRTTILGVAITLPLLNSSYGHEDIALSLSEWTNHIRSRSMREEGLEMRFTYKQDTERLERYTEMGVDVDAITKSDAAFIAQLSAQKKSGIPIKDIDTPRLNEIKQKLELNAQKGVCFLSLKVEEKKDDLKNLKSRGCTKKEAAIFYRVTKSIKEKEIISLDAAERKLFNLAAAKIAQERFSLHYTNIEKLSIDLDEDQVRDKLSLLSFSTELTNKILNEWQKCKAKHKPFRLSSSLSKEILSLRKSRRTISNVYFNEAWHAPLAVVLDDLLPKPEEQNF